MQAFARLSTIVVSSLLLATAAVAADPPADSAKPAAAESPMPTLTGDALDDAHTLVTSGHRDKAIETLANYLKTRPTNSDVQIYYGIVLSWEGRYDDARKELNAVLKRSPTNSDALGALFNVEMWDDKPAAAEALTRRALAQRGYASFKPREANAQNVSFLVSRARALYALDRLADAKDVVKQALAIEPTNEQAIRLRNSLDDRMEQWRLSESYGGDWFSDGRTPWHESATSISRGTPAGSVITRVSHAERFGYTDNQFEVEMYPRIHPGTYAYVEVGVAPAAVLYPSVRFSADVYHSLGGGYEASVGIRQLHFASTVNIYVTTVTKYKGNWMLTGKAFFIPDQLEGSRSFHGSVRRYLSGADTYVGIRYGHGFARQELYTLEDFVSVGSDTLAAEANVLLGRRLTASVSGSASRQERPGLETLNQYSLSGGLSVRF